jgi:hypothetical protein
VCSINNKYYTGATIYIRAIKIEKDGEQYGTYYQAVRSYREKGKVKQEVIHLGEYQTAEAALAAWPQEIKELRRIGRPRQARKLQDKLDRLQELREGADLTPVGDTPTTERNVKLDTLKTRFGVETRCMSGFQSGAEGSRTPDLRRAKSDP